MMLVVVTSIVRGVRSTLTRSARLSRNHGATIAPTDLSHEKT